MTRAEFERLVVEAIRLIPKRFRREMQNLALVVEEEPNAELLAEMEVEPPDSLYGLYQGIPLPGTHLGARQCAPRLHHAVPASHRSRPRSRGRDSRCHRRDPHSRSRPLLSGSAKRKSRRSRSGTGGVTRSAPMRTTSEGVGTSSVGASRLGHRRPFASAHSPCLSRPPERMWTDAAYPRTPPQGGTA